MQEKYSGDSLNAITWWENFESFLVEGAYLESVSKEAYLKMFENLGSDSTSDLEILNFIAFIVEYERQEFNIRCFLEDEYSHGDFVFFEQSKWADLYKTILGLNNTIKNPRIFFSTVSDTISLRDLNEPFIRYSILDLMHTTFWINKDFFASQLRERL